MVHLTLNKEELRILKYWLEHSEINFNCMKQVMPICTMPKSYVDQHLTSDYLLKKINKAFENEEHS